MNDISYYMSIYCKNNSLAKLDKENISSDKKKENVRNFTNVILTNYV